MVNPLPRLVPTEPLDIMARNTVSEIVDGMSKCAFGARNLGEVTRTIEHWIREGTPPIVIYEPREDCPLAALLRNMKKRGWIRDIRGPMELGGAKEALREDDYPFVVIGKFSDYQDSIIEQYRIDRRVIYINQHGLCQEGQVRDGYFPDVVFGDPNYVLPVIYACLRERFDLIRISVPDLIFTLSKLRMPGVAAEVAHGAETLRMMTADEECWNLLTLSGAMTIAKQGKIFTDLIETGTVNYVASTGALMSHGLIESMGLEHFKYDPGVDDETLLEHGMNRVTDTLEPETNFDHLDVAMNEVLRQFADGSVLSPSILHDALGEYLNRRFPEENGILKSAHLNGVPVLVPAFHDSELGNDVYCHNKIRQRRGRKKLLFDQEIDTEVLFNISQHSERMGIFSWGGGVPRNFTQNVAPLIHIFNNRLGTKKRLRKFLYGLRVAPDPMWLGHLSGCTYSEGGSWGKMDLVNGRFTEIHADVTMVGAFLVKFVFDTRGYSHDQIRAMADESNPMLQAFVA